MLDVVARWAGSSHDSIIYQYSNLCRRFRNGEFGADSIILGDSAYPPERNLCKPLNRPNPNIRSEKDYQACQIKARNVVERLNGQLKQEFRVLANSTCCSIFCHIS